MDENMQESVKEEVKEPKVMAQVRPLVIIGVNDENHQMVVQTPQGDDNLVQTIFLLADAIKLLTASQKDRSPIIQP